MKKNSIKLRVSIWAAIILVTICLCSCTKEEKTLSVLNGSEPVTVEVRPGPSKNEEGFGVNSRDMNLLKLLDNGTGGNLLFSPAGMDQVLSMAELAAANETRQQITNFTGGSYRKLDSDAVKTYNAILYNRDIKAVKIKDSYLQALRDAEWLSGDVYGIDSANERQVVEGINQTIKETTSGMFEQALRQEDLDVPNFVMMLTNTIGFKGTWENGELLEKNGIFQNRNGKNVKVSMLSVADDEAAYYENDTVVGFSIRYAENDGRYSFAAFMPKAESRELDYNTLDVWDLKTPCDVQLKVSFPGFSFDSENNLINVTEKMGITDLYDKSVCDLANGFDYEPGNLCADLFKQKVRITVDKQGTAAAAYTEMRITAAAVEELPERRINLCFNRPFVFIIYDRDLDEPLFIGQINELPGTETNEAPESSIQ